MKKIILTFFLGFTLVLNAFAQANPDEIRRKIQKVFPNSGQFEQTFVPRVWANIKDAGTQSMFVFDDVQSTLNNGGNNKGFWRTIKDKQRLPENEQQARFATIYESVKSLRPIPQGNAQEGAMLLITAVDCPACIELEREFAKRKTAYWVAPTYLSDINRPKTQAAYCNVNPTKAWGDSMQRRGVTGSKSAKCEYPDKEYQQLLWMTGGTTPAALFPDGTVAVGIRPIAQRLGIPVDN